MSTIVKTTWAKADFNNRNIFPVKEEIFSAKTEDIFNDLWRDIEIF